MMQPIRSPARLAARLLSPSMRALLRRTIACLLFYSGALWLYSRYRLRGRAVVLMYHRVLPSGADSFSTDGIVVSPATFALQMRFLRKHFNVLSADEFRSCLTRGAFPHRACLITFDDGWYDNEVYALPILSQLNLPAVIFLATGYVGTVRTFWQEETARILLSGDPRGLTNGELVGRPFDRSLSSDTESDRKRAALQFVATLKAASQIQIDSTCDRIRSSRGGTASSTNANGDDRFMDWEAVRRLSRSGLVTIASHAHRHIPLTRLEIGTAMDDVRHSLDVIEQQGLERPILLAYPNGDFNKEVTEAVQMAGIEMAFTTQSGLVRVTDDPLTLRRMNVHEASGSTPAEFLCRTLGLF